MKIMWLVCALLLCGRAEAATYYVSTAGSDSNSCVAAQSISTPKRNIMGAGGGLICVTAGDTLSIRGGVYAESIDSNAQSIPNGTSWANAPTISSYPSEVAVITSVNLANELDDYLIFDRITIDNNFTSNEGISFNGADFVRFQNGVVRESNQGVFVHTASSNIDIINNEIHGNGNTQTPGEHGIYVEGDASLIEHNNIHNNWNYGIHVYNGGGQADGNIVRYNNIHDNGIGTATSFGILIGSGVGSTAYNNLVYRNRGGIQVGYGASANTAVYHNTIFDNIGDGVQVLGGTGHIVRNNIFYLNGLNEDYLVSTTHDHNLTADPSFVNPAGGDYHLLSGSMAIDAGVTIASVTDDYESNVRPQGAAYDVGAYEFISGPPLGLPTAPTNLNVANSVLTWEQQAAMLSEVLAYTYQYYADGSPTGVELLVWTCGDTTPVSCQAPLPAFNNGKHSLTMSATNTAGEGPQSSPVCFRRGRKVNC